MSMRKKAVKFENGVTKDSYIIVEKGEHEGWVMTRRAAKSHHGFDLDVQKGLIYKLVNGVLKLFKT